MLRRLISRFSEAFPNNAFVRGVSILMGGSALGQALTMLASPVLTRLYSPEDFGALAVYASLLGILGVLACLRYQLAIPIPDNDRDAVALASLSLFILISNVLICALVLLAMSDFIASALGVPLLAEYFWLLPTGLFLLGLYQISTTLGVRAKAYSVMARTKLVQPFSMLTIQLSGYLLGPAALLFGHAVGQGAGALSLGRHALRRHWHLLGELGWKDLRVVAQRYRYYPIYSTWTGLFSAAGNQLPTLLLAAWFNPVVAGIYMLANRVVATPIQLVGQSIEDVFFGNAVEARKEGRLNELIEGLYRNLASIALPPTAFFVVLAPALFGWLFGERWVEAGLYAQWMGPWAFSVLVSSPINRLFLVLDKQSHGMLFGAALLSLRVCALGVGALQDDVMLGISLFFSVSLLCRFAMVVWAFRATGVSLLSLMSASISALVWSSLVVAPMLIVSTLFEEQSVLIPVILSALIMIGRLFFIAKSCFARRSATN